jgi:hypothetical protein
LSLGRRILGWRVFLRRRRRGLLARRILRQEGQGENQESREEKRISHEKPHLKSLELNGKMRKLEFWARQNSNAWQRVIHHEGHREHRGTQVRREEKAL